MKRSLQRPKDQGAVMKPSAKSSTPRADPPPAPQGLTPIHHQGHPMGPGSTGGRSEGHQGGTHGEQGDASHLQHQAIEQRYEGLKQHILAFQRPKIMVIVPSGSSPHLEEMFQAYLSAGGTSKVYHQHKGANGEAHTEIPPPKPPGYWTSPSLKATFEQGGVLVRFQGAGKETALRAIARFEVLTNALLTTAHATPGKPRVRVLVSERDPSMGTPPHHQSHSSDAIRICCRLQQPQDSSEELSQEEWQHIQRLAAQLQMSERVLVGFPRDLLRILVGCGYRQERIRIKEPPKGEPAGPSLVQSGALGPESSKSPSQDSTTPDLPSDPSPLPLDPGGGYGQTSTTTPMPQGSADAPGAGIHANEVPDGYPWASYQEEDEDRRRYDQLQRLVKESRTSDDEAWLRQFRSKCRQKRSLAAKLDRHCAPFPREAMSSAISLWQALLESPLQVKVQATDRRIDEVRSSRRQAGRDLPAVEEVKARRVMHACQKAMESYAINSVSRLDDLRSKKLLRSLSFPVPTPTRKGHLLLCGEPPEVTMMVHDHLHRSGITRPMLDFEFSAPDGFDMDPRWAQYIAIRLATRLGVDPRRVIAGTHDPTKEESKRRPGNPVKAHAHVAIPVAFPDGSYLHVPHLPAIIQAELAAINAEIGMPQHVAIAMRGRYAASMRLGADHLYVERRYDPSRFKEETRKKYRMNDHGVVRLPLTKFDREVAVIPFPALEHITCPAGVAHINTMSQKRRLAAAGDQRRYNAALRELINIRRGCKSSERALRDHDAFMSSQLVHTHPVTSAASALNHYITGEAQEITRTNQVFTDLLQSDLMALKQQQNKAEAFVLSLRVGLQQIWATHRYIKDMVTDVADK